MEIWLMKVFPLAIMVYWLVQLQWIKLFSARVGRNWSFIKFKLRLFSDRSLYRLTLGHQSPRAPRSFRVVISRQVPLAWRAFKPIREWSSFRDSINGEEFSHETYALFGRLKRVETWCFSGKVALMKNWFLWRDVDRCFIARSFNMPKNDFIDDQLSRLLAGP